jgi:hypothetical protein
MRQYFSPKGSRFGLHPAFVGTKVTANITASGSDIIDIPTPYRRCAVLGFTVSTVTVPTGSSTITAKLQKYDASATALVDLTSTTDLKTLTTKQSRNVALTSTLTDAQRTIDDSDTLTVLVASAGTVTAQPTNLCFTVELAIME